MNTTGKEQIIRKAISEVLDPATKIPAVEAGLISSVDVKMKSATVELYLPCAKEDYFYKQDLEDEIAQKLLATNLVKEVTFKYYEMNDEELNSYAAQIEASALTNQGFPRFLDKSTRIIAISSGKGGVGKSSVTLSLALEVAKSHTVALLDADIYGFSIPKMMGITHDPFVIKDVIIPVKKWGVKVISMGFFLDDSQPVLWRGPMLHKVLSQLINDVHWGFPEFLFIDMPPGTGDVALSLSELLPSAEFYVITTPQMAATRVAGRSAYAAKAMKLPVRGVIENMSYFQTNDGKIYHLFGKGGGQTLAETLKVPLLGAIPFSPEALESLDSGTPIVITQPENNYCKVIAEVSSNIVNIGPQRRFRKELKIVSSN